MKFSLKKFIRHSAALVLSAGALFLSCGFTVRIPYGVKVNGTPVGGMTVSAAKALLRGEVERALKQKRLHICTDERVYVYSFPEIDYRDSFELTLLYARRGASYSSPVYYFLNGAEEIAEAIAADVEKPVVEPYATFFAAGEPFEYFPGNDGVECDRQKLLDDVSLSLNGSFEDVRVCTRALMRSSSVDEVVARTKKLCSFTTYFDGDNPDRSVNIRLAASKINGTVIPSGGTFSFNSTVGARTAENGFRQAKIIENGKFVKGYGGGVCQVSTTVYNAALLSGMSITEFHPHSLQVGYVAPSRDAMVSGSYFDLKFANTRETPVYVRMSCTLNSVTCTLYGESDGWEYSFKSKVVEVVPRPDTEYVEGDEDKIISYGRDGTVSEGYLLRTRNGETEEELLRRDSYPAIADVVQKRSGSAA